MKKLFNEEQEKFILDNYLTMRYKDIAKELGNFTATQITSWLNNRGLNKPQRNSIFSNKDKEFMKNHYKDMAYKEIGNILGFSERQIRGWINNNCETKLRIFNKRYFQYIDTPIKAYWLGFIYADGWVINNPERANYEFGIYLQSCDIKSLEDLNNEFGGVHDIKPIHKEHYICEHKEISITDGYCLRIFSKDIVNDLIAHEILPNKTEKSNFPKEVIDSYFFDFLRGYIDGDGCIYVNNNNIKSSQVHITSAHREILDYISLKLEKEYEIKSTVYQEKERKYRIVFYGENILKLLNQIYYSENIPKLERKYQKYLILKNTWLS